MNLPENLSAGAKKLYDLLSNSESPKSSVELASAYSSQTPNEEQYKAISTADSLVIKGIVTVEKAKDESTQDVYTLVRNLADIGPSEEADANEEYAQKTDANNEEKRMIDILEKGGKHLPANELFKLYLKEQTPDNNTSTDEELKAALQELTGANLITSDGEKYQVSK